MSDCTALPECLVNALGFKPPPVAVTSTDESAASGPALDDLVPARR